MINIEAHLDAFEAILKTPVPYLREGRLVGVKGLTLEAEGCHLAVGGRCHILDVHGRPVQAEVVGFSEDRVYLMPVGKYHELKPGAKVIPSRAIAKVPAGEALLGRVINGEGRAIDGLGDIQAEHWIPLQNDSLNPLSRQGISEPLDVGIRSINGLLTIGKGQRIGLFAGTGVGKSVLLGMMTRFTNADVTIVGLIGERGREIKEFIDEHLGQAGLKQAIVVAAPADDPPLMRIHGSMMAVRLAEYYRDQGKNVLLLMDSLTRYAQAQREISLSIGEPPVSKGYPPSVFSNISNMIERTSNGLPGSGTITALYTVLVEGDDHNEPISDSTKAILDGHIVLSRSLAERGLYPAVDVPASISRVMNQITTQAHQKDAMRFKQIYSTYQNNSDLISVGAYVKGSDSKIDESIQLMPNLETYLKQAINESHTLASSITELPEQMMLVAPPQDTPVN